MSRRYGSKRSPDRTVGRGEQLGNVFLMRYLLAGVSLAAIVPAFAAQPSVKTSGKPSPVSPVVEASPAAVASPAAGSAPASPFVSISQEVKDVFERSRHAVVKIHGQ